MKSNNIDINAAVELWEKEFARNSEGRMLNKEKKERNNFYRYQPDNNIINTGGFDGKKLQSFTKDGKKIRETKHIFLKPRYLRRSHVMTTRKTVYQMLCVLGGLQELAGDYIIPTFFKLHKRMSDKRNIEILGKAIYEYDRFLNDYDVSGMGGCNRVPNCPLNGDDENYSGNWCTWYSYWTSDFNGSEMDIDCNGPSYGTCSISYIIEQLGFYKHVYWNRHQNYEPVSSFPMKKVSDILSRMSTTIKKINRRIC